MREQTSIGQRKIEQTNIKQTYIEEILEHYVWDPGRELLAEELDFAKQHVLDLLGCGIAGAGLWEDCPMPGSGISLWEGGEGEQERIWLWGSKERGTLESAVIRNGCQAACQELDDATAIGASVHPGASVIPAALAAAQSRRTGGMEFLKMVLAGYEVCSRFGLMASDQMQNLGLYGPAFIGAGAAAVAMGGLLGLDRRQLPNAFSAALSLAPVCPFIQFTDDSRLKHYYNGWSLLAAVTAVRLAARGAGGTSRITEGPRSLETIYLAGGRLENWEHRYGLDVECKPYACCKSVQYALTAAEQLKKDWNLDAARIRGVRVETYPYAWELSRGVEALGKDSARLSIPYCLAVLLLEGEVLPDAFLPDKLKDPKVLDLMDRVVVTCGEGYETGAAGKRGAVVEILLENGDTLRRRSDRPKWSQAEPPGWEELEDKFLRITGDRLDRDRARAMITAVRHLEELSDVGQLSGERR